MHSGRRTPLNYTLVNIKDWCKNHFEVIHQLRINTDNSHHRYDVLILINGVPCVQIELKTLGVNVNQHVCIIRTIPNELDSLFLNHFLISERGQRQMDSFQAGGNRQGLNFAQVRSFALPLPPLFGEQQRIASCLSSLDALITAEARKLEALNTHKKGLMQQLFPSPEEVEA